MKKLEDLVKDAGKIAISGHVRPDGDCVGSVMAVYLYLRKNMPEKEVSVFLEKPADIYHEIKDIDVINSKFSSEEAFDIFLALDCNKERLGRAEAIFDNAKQTVNIDHHISNEGCGDINIVVPDASSTCEVIYDLLDKEKLDIEIAKAIYIGVISDTGVFKYSNTSPKTLRMAADLITYGFDFPKLIDETFYEKTYIQNQIMGRAVMESVRFMDGKCIFSAVDKKMMDFYQVTAKDLDGIVNQLRIIKGVECAIFMYQTATLEYKVSLRSNRYVDVAKVASFFGGGGHVRAAGCTMKGTVHDVINNLSDRIYLQIEGENL